MTELAHGKGLYANSRTTRYIFKRTNKEKLTEEEGCLSCPKKLEEVRRSIYVGLKWTCTHGKEQYKTFYYLPSRVVQHEMDHLNGKLIIDPS